MSYENLMRYEKPASEWINGIPIGNGRLAAMIYGNSDEILALNHENL